MQMVIQLNYWLPPSTPFPLSKTSYLRKNEWDFLTENWDSLWFYPEDLHNTLLLQIEFIEHGTISTSLPATPYFISVSIDQIYSDPTYSAIHIYFIITVTVFRVRINRTWRNRMNSYHSVRWLRTLNNSK